MGNKINDEQSLYEQYHLLSKTEYSFLLCRIKSFHLYPYLYGKECTHIIFNGVEQTLIQTLSETAFFYRLHSDHYIVFLKTQDPFLIIQTIYEIDQFLEKFQFEGIHHTIALSIGIFFLRKDVDFFQAYDHAKFAQQNSKELTKYNTTFDFYDQKDIEFVKQQFQLVSSLKVALEDREFEIYLQPKVNAKTHAIVGAEALVRWVHQGLEVPLHVFMPLIDKNTFIRKIDLFVFDEVCKLITRWKLEHIPLLPISVNIARASFEDGFYYLKEIEQIFNRYQIDKNLIEFELSEEICFQNNHRLHRFLKLLSTHGFTCSLDDFGSGYSSFLALTYLPIKTIKLDSSFCLGTWDKKKKIILTHLLDLLNELKFQIVVEGVEQEEVVRFFAHYPTYQLQGFYFSKPLPIRLFEEYYFQVNQL